MPGIPHVRQTTAAPAGRLAMPRRLVGEVGARLASPKEHHRRAGDQPPDYGQQLGEADILVRTGDHAEHDERVDAEKHGAGDPGPFLSLPAGRGYPEPERDRDDGLDDREEGHGTDGGMTRTGWVESTGGGFFLV